MRHVAWLGLLSSSLAFAGSNFPGKVLVTGGGYEPNRSQVVLEQNVKLFSSLAERFGLDGQGIRYLFAGGKGVDDIVQTDLNYPDDEWLFSRLFVSVQDPEDFLRPNELPQVDGSLTKSNIQNSFSDLGRELGAKDVFRFYFTGHGHGDPYEAYKSNYMALWKNDQMTVQEFTQSLDKIPSTVQSQVLMVQCFSGGFSQINYEGGEFGGKLSSADRCGFFSQIRSRPAAGCSPDLTKREEYSPYFFAAFAGKRENGMPVNADFDGDGKVSSDEAHAYVILSENSIDIPVTTSSELLRDQRIDLTAEMTERPLDGFRTSIKKLKTHEAAIDNAVLDGLLKQVADGDEMEKAPLKAIQKHLMAIGPGKRRIQAALSSAVAELRRTASVVRKELTKDFPILQEKYKNSRMERVPQDSEYVKAREAFLASKGTEDYRKAYVVYKSAIDNYLNGEHESVKWERLQYLLESVLMAEALDTSGKSEVQEKYSALKKCESAGFFN